MYTTWCGLSGRTRIVSMATSEWKRLSRRAALKKIGKAAGLCGVAVHAPHLLSYPAGDRGAATAFALIGDRYHNSDYIRTGLGKTLGKDLGLPIDFSDEITLLRSSHLKNYKLLIILRDGMLWPDGYTDESSNAGYV